MNIVHISTSDLIGGAAIAAYRLNLAFNKKGFNSKMLVLNSVSNNISVVPFDSKIKYFKHIFCFKIEQYIQKRIFNNNYTYSLGLRGESIRKHPLLRKADIIYIHWVGNSFISMKEIRKVALLGKPIYLFLHDMYYITGGCHHSFDCDGYKSNCIGCTNIHNPSFKWVANRILEKKRNLWNDLNNLHIITPSLWLSDCVRESTLFRNTNTTTIPNILDTTSFKVLDRKIARSILNLPNDKKLICFGANGGSKDPYKGWNILLESIKYMTSNNVEVVLFGGMLSYEEEKRINFRIHQLGYFHDSYSLILMYNACDVFVTPSLAENFPQTITESIACGTPCVGFNIGGIPDLIKHKQTGYLAKYKDVKDLAKGIDWVLNDTSITREYLHNFAEKMYSENIIVEKHIGFWNVK